MPRLPKVVTVSSVDTTAESTVAGPEVTVGAIEAAVAHFLCCCPYGGGLVEPILL